MAILDHIGLNRYIYMTASMQTMTLGSFNMNDIKNSLSQSIIGGHLDDSRLLLGINLYNNGPYGFSSWQQLRLSENPLFRHLKKNNFFPVTNHGKERVIFSNNIRQTTRDRHGTTTLYEEPPVVSLHKPLLFSGGTTEIVSNRPTPKKIGFPITMNNNITFFANNEINGIAGIVKTTDESYDVLKSYYLDNQLDSDETPIDEFDFLTFQQTIYPPHQYTYKSYTRARTTFSFNWRDSLSNRQQKNASSGFSISVLSSSFWPLDVDPNWANFSTPLIENLGLRVSGSGTLKTSSFGILWNHYSQVAHDLDGGTANQRLMPSALYSRRHSVTTKESVVAPTGRTELTRSSNMDSSTIFGGEAAWDTPTQSGKRPFYDSYDDFSDQIKRKGKSSTIVPEFRMSEHVERFIKSGSLSIPDDIFSINGGKQGDTDSSNDEFYKIYSTSDFLENFDIILEDHKDFTTPSKLTLKCKAIKKLIPYNGFYPVQRTVDITRQFHSSYSSFIQEATGSSSTYFGQVNFDVNHSKQNLYTPLFAPGVLYNTIKSGVACDYPIITSDLLIGSGSIAGAYHFKNSTFDKRIPFEALVEPEKYLANYQIVNNEPHPSGNLSSSCFWDGSGDRLYSMMANNFLAEIPNFFLSRNNFSTLASLPQGDPNFGQVLSKNITYAMRIKMFRSMDQGNPFVSSSVGGLYQAPQDIIVGQKETITMYSRPSAFGPPTIGFSQSDASKPYTVPDISGISHTHPIGLFISPSQGFNYPFTPPYYHGQAWADVVFQPTENRKYTIDEILASSSVTYHRFDKDPYLVNGPTISSEQGPQSLSKVNDNAMHLNASLNIFNKGILQSEVEEQVIENLQNVNIQIDDQSRSRWIIQPKFETPILNFSDYIDANGHTSNVSLPNNASSASVPIGMWHQYGRVPSESEGIYLQVTDIPKSWVTNKLNKTYGDATGPSQSGTGSLADLCGFSTTPVKLGRVAEAKRVSECVVAVPFYEMKGVKKFIKLDGEKVTKAINGNSAEVDDSIVDMIDKMKRFVFPPSMDFVHYPDEIDAIAMYIFEFSSQLSQQDLTDIWQNVLPDIGRTHEEEEVTISHSLTGVLQEKPIKLSNLKSDIRWMVFKVKQRADSRYYDKVFSKQGDKRYSLKESLKSGILSDPAGAISNIQYNWPYDFFSLVELVKIDTKVQLSDVEEDDSTATPKKKISTRERRDIRTLTPRIKK